MKQNDKLVNHDSEIRFDFSRSFLMTVFSMHGFLFTGTVIWHDKVTTSAESVIACIDNSISIKSENKYKEKEKGIDLVYRIGKKTKVKANGNFTLWGNFSKSWLSQLSEFILSYTSVVREHELLLCWEFSAWLRGYLFLWGESEVEHTTFVEKNSFFSM